MAKERGLRIAYAIETGQERGPQNDRFLLQHAPPGECAAVNRLPWANSLFAAGIGAEAGALLSRVLFASASEADSAHALGFTSLANLLRLKLKDLYLKPSAMRAPRYACGHVFSSPASTKNIISRIPGSEQNAAKTHRQPQQ